MNAPHNILIIAFKFPPLGGMRVKRMSMFAKYLAQRGYRVHVITVNWRVRAPNTWAAETKNPKIIVHRISSWAPHNLLYRLPESLPAKLLSRAVHLLRRGLYFVDEAQWWGLSLLPYATRLIKTENITNVICTGAPFMANYWAARLKHKLPHIHLIQDLRDPWNDHLCAPYSHYFRFGWQKNQSRRYEHYALTNADVIVSVTDSLTELFKRRVESPARFVTISNGFDTEKYSSLSSNPNREKMRMVYIGNLFVGRDQVISRFLRTVEELADENPDFSHCFELVTYGGFPHSVRQAAASLIRRGILRIYGYVTPEEALQIAGNAFALLLVTAEFFTYPSGKIYEYIALRRPIYAITPEGEASRLVRRGNLGEYVAPGDPAEQKKSLLKLFDLWKRNPAYTPPVKQDFIQEFRYDRLVNRLIACFKQRDGEKASIGQTKGWSQGL